MGVRDRLRARMQRQVSSVTPVQTQPTTALPASTGLDAEDTIGSPNTALPPQPAEDATSPLLRKVTEAAASGIPSNISSFDEESLSSFSLQDSRSSRSKMRYKAGKLRDRLRLRRPRSAASEISQKTEEGPELQLPGTSISELNGEHPEETPLSDGFVGLTVPQGWRAVQQTDAFYLLAGRGVGFVRVVPAAVACEALLDTSRLSVMSEVACRASPVWVGNEARVEYDLVGGFGVGIAKYEDGFDKGAVVFAICAPVQQAEMVSQAVEALRSSAHVVKVPEASDLQDTSISNGNGEKRDGKKGGGDQRDESPSSEATCVVQ